MLVFFPTPYPDELYYSIIARYIKWSGEPHYRSLLQSIFGNKHVTASVDLPSNIGRLVERLPVTSQLTVEQLIQKHTMFPFYSAFLPPEQAEAVRKSMIEGNGNEIYSRIGVMGSAIRPNKFIRYCKECLSHDLETYGESYWHRIHQLPGLDVCVEHGIELLDSNISPHGENKYKFVAADKRNSPLNCVAKRTPRKDFEKYCSLSKNIRILLDNKFPYRSREWFGQYYLNKLQELRYASIIGRNVDQDRLCHNFISFYGESFLERFQSGIHLNNNWLKLISRKHQRSFHPIRHLLLLQFLNCNIHEVFYRNEPYKPFGNGPWMCMNPAADHYEKLVINDFALSLEARKPIGTFSCGCGFIYTRSIGEDAKNEFVIKQFGAIWEKEAVRLAKTGLSLQDIGNRLHVGVQTINKYINKDGCCEMEKEKIQEEKQRQEDRMKWKVMQKEHPHLSKTKLRDLNPKLYNRLHRFDRLWLEKESPPGERKGTPSKPRINWSVRDQDFSEKIKRAVVILQSREGKPKQISISSIGHEIGHKWILEKQLDKLPITKALLEQVVESKEHYRWRRIKWAVEELKRHGRAIVKWDVLRMAGVRSEFMDPSFEVMVSEWSK
ncbi:TnsD family transposase [Paenibacillus elgii]